MPPAVLRLGDLEIAFTTSFRLGFDTKGKRTRRSSAFYHPLPPEGFQALGSVGLPSLTDANGVVAAPCVRQAAGTGGSLLARPVDYTWVWDDTKTGGQTDGTCWRPVPPPGYRALGNVFVNSYDKPSLDDVVCVKEELTIPVEAGDLLWDDGGGGGKYDFSAWRIAAPTGFVDDSPGATKAVIASESFVALGGYDKPSRAPELYALLLPLPSEHTEVTPVPPQLTGRTRPAAATAAVSDHRVRVPLTAVRDDAKSMAWRVENSPYYTIERRAWWSLLLFNDNRTSSDQTVEDAVTVGVEKTSSETFQASTAVSVTAEAGVKVFGIGATVSATVSTELGYESSTSVSEFRSRTLTRRLVTPKNTAGALWVGSYGLRTLRADGSVVATQLKFDGDAFHHAQYPEVQGETTTSPASGSGSVPAQARLTPKHSGKAVDVAGGYAATQDGVLVHQWEWLNGSNQKWRLEPVADGYYRLIAQHSGKALTVDQESTGDGAAIVQAQWTGAAGQQWRVEPAGDGHYRLTARHSGKVLDVAGGPADQRNGVQLRQWEWLAADNQRFRLDPTS
ncbi:RICIN domain-containing protein [Kitasatospora sp. NPDC048298]|uniref:RICIN domain-containing protein n=1 Tax=Kitasatospora sp. NPDC048298 TaxID=3364049 RepID=UPI00371DC4C2